MAKGGEYRRRIVAALACCGCAAGRGSVGDAVDHGGSLVSEVGHIAFMRATDFEAPGIESDVYVLDVGGSGERRLTDASGLDGFPAWSPDGERLAFVSDRDGGDDWEIYVMDADGSEQTRLTDTPEDEEFCGWSPDGERIAYVTTT